MRLSTKIPKSFLSLVSYLPNLNLIVVFIDGEKNNILLK
jgi:hypothetical protein